MKRILRGTELPEIPGILGGLKTGNKGGPGGFREIPDHPPRPVCSLDILASDFTFFEGHSGKFWENSGNFRENSGKFWEILGNSGNFRGLLKILDREFQGL